MTNGPEEVPASKSKPPDSNIRWNIVILLMAYSFFSWFNRVSMSVAGTEKIIPSGELNETQMGDIYFALLLAYAICMVPGGWFVDRVGPRLALMVMGFGSAFFVAGTGVTAMLVTAGMGLYVGLLVVRALMGIFTAPVYPASGKVVAVELPWHRRSWANGTITGSAPLGIACAPFVFGGLIDLRGWPQAFIVMGVLTTAVAAIWMAVTAGRLFRPPALLEKQKETAGPPRGSVWALFRNRSLMLLTLGYGMANYYEYLFFFWGQYLFKDVMHLGKIESRVYSGLLFLASGFGMFAGGWLSDRLSRGLGLRFSRLGVPIIGLLLGAVFLAPGLLLSDPTWKFVFLAAAMAAVGVCEGPCWSTAIEIGGRRGGTSAALVNTGGNVGGMLAPFLTPRAAHFLGWSWAVSLGGVACLAGLVMLAFVDPHDRIEGET